MFIPYIFLPPLFHNRSSSFFMAKNGGKEYCWRKHGVSIRICYAGDFEISVIQAQDVLEPGGLDRTPIPRVGNFKQSQRYRFLKNG
jgi:hypothetical protein